MKKILAVDDNEFECAFLKSVVGTVQGYQVLTAECGRSALDAIGRVPLDAVILDVRLPDIDGLEVLKQVKSAHPFLPVIMLTGMADIQTAVEAIKGGAHNYLTKPYDNEQLLLTLRHAIEKNEILTGKKELVQKAWKGPALFKIAGQSAGIRAVLQQIQKVADSSLTVLVQGETGTGKEPVARALHEESSRWEEPFLAIDCGALPENLLESELFGHEKGAFSGAEQKKQGQFELAGKGTLFLDEIGNLPLSLQAKLLRVLQERQVRPVGAAKAFPVQMRIVAASNTHLEEAVKSGQFRQDLYFRLAEFTLHLPPLRSRREDILPLAHSFREEACSEFKKQVSTITSEAVRLLTGHAWPGNVRELRNVIRQAVLLAPDNCIHEEQIRPLLGAPSGGKAPVTVENPIQPGLNLKRIAEKAAEEAEKQTLTQVLRSTGGNKSQAAKMLQVDYKTLRLKIKKYGLEIPKE